MFEDDSTQQEIAEAVGLTKKTIDNRLEECVNLTTVSKLHKLSALFEEDGFSIQHLHISDLRQSIFHRYEHEGTPEKVPHIDSVKAGDLSTSPNGRK